MTGHSAKAFLNRIITNIDEGKAPQQTRSTSLIRSLAAPTAIGLAIGISGCAGDVEEPQFDREDIRQAKADGFMDNYWCMLLGADPECDICEELGWYNDGICDDFCSQPDSEDCNIEPPLPGSCLSNSDCEEGYECEFPMVALYAVPPFPEPDPTGMCVPIDDPPPPPGSCLSNSDCEEGYECEFPMVALYAVPPFPEPDPTGFCQPVSDCNTDDDCAEGYHCEGAVGECPDGAFCILPPSPGECVIDAPVDCSDRTLSECEVEGECKIVEDGCEEPFCDEDGCYPCDPVAMCAPDDCYSDGDCAEGYECEGAIGECPDGAICILPPTPGQCLPE